LASKRADSASWGTGDVGLRIASRLDVPIDGLFVADLSGTANPLSDGGLWIHGATDGLLWKDVQVVNGLACGTQDGTTGPPYDDTTGLVRGLWLPNQKVRGRVRVAAQNSSSFCEVEIRLRSTIRANWNTGYEINFRNTSDGSQYSELVRFNGPLGTVSGGGGAYTYLEQKNAANGIPGLQDGDIFEAWAVDDLISVFLNDALLYTHDLSGDSANQFGVSKFSSGSPGMGFWRRNNGQSVNNTDFGFDQFRAWDSRYAA